MNPWLQAYFIIQSGVLNFFATIPLDHRFFHSRLLSWIAVLNL